LRHLLPLVYEELRRVARRHLRGERPDHTLQTTALIHEAYLRLVDQGTPQVADRCHFVALTSHLMRQILVDHARARLAQKRDGGCRITLAEDLASTEPGEVTCSPSTGRSAASPCSTLSRRGWSSYGTSAAF